MGGAAVTPLQSLFAIFGGLCAFSLFILGCAVVSYLVERDGGRKERKP
jgi:hypothetical protein